MKIYFIFTVLSTCITASLFSEFHNEGSPGYNDECSLRSVSTTHKNRAKKAIARRKFLSQNRLMGCFSSDVSTQISKFVGN